LARLPGAKPPTSNQKETTAVLQGLSYWKSILLAHHVNALMIRSDNSPTVCNLQRQGAGHSLLFATRKIFSLLLSLDIRIQVTHIPGKDNSLADALSRMDRTGDYELKTEYYLLGTRSLEVRPTIDLFANSLNHKCPIFAALPGPLATGATYVDARTAPWNEGLPYLFPPVQLVGEVIRTLLSYTAEAVLVYPEWPAQPWWSALRMGAIKTVELGKSEEVLSPGVLMKASPYQVKLPPGKILMSLWRTQQ
jgi:hypothetical protein